MILDCGLSGANSHDTAVRRAMQITDSPVASPKQIFAISTRHFEKARDRTYHLVGAREGRKGKASEWGGVFCTLTPLIDTLSQGDPRLPVRGGAYLPDAEALRDQRVAVLSPE
jgi:hypothetical protein